MSKTTQKKTYAVVITEDLQEGGFVGRCDELHANTQGETYSEVMKNMEEVMKLTAEEFDGVTDFDMTITRKP